MSSFETFGIELSNNVQEQNFTNTLSSDSLSFNTDLTALQNSFEQLLSTIQIFEEIPKHPYERLKYDLFGKDYTFLTINDLSASDDFDLEKSIEQIKKVSKLTEKSTQRSLSGLEAFIKSHDTKSIKVSSLEEFLLQQKELEKDVVDEELSRKNIEFSEIVRSISFEDIETRPKEIAKLLLSHYTNLYAP